MGKRLSYTAAIRGTLTGHPLYTVSHTAAQLGDTGWSSPAVTRWSDIATTDRLMKGESVNVEDGSRGRIHLGR
eukprot:348978-Prorocentrum_minimum.AAC.1